MSSSGRRERILSSIFELVAEGSSHSRALISRETGLARSTVGMYVDRLLADGLLTESIRSTSDVGRPARRLEIGTRAGVAAVLDLRLTGYGLAIVDLARRVIVHEWHLLEPETSMPDLISAVRDRLNALTTSSESPEPLRVRRLVVSVPSPIDSARGLVAGVSNTARIWNHIPLTDEFEAALGIPVVVENDANLRAVAEARHQDAVPLIYMHLGAGVGGGLVDMHGEIHRGADGAAGDIGHLPLAGADAPPCPCGRPCCIGGVVTSDWLFTEAGLDPAAPDAPRSLKSRLLSADQQARHAIREYAAVVGKIGATVANFYNPRVMVLGGDIAEFGDDVLSGVRASVYEHSLPIISRNLAIRSSDFADDGILRGGGTLATRAVLTTMAADLAEEP